MEPAIIDWKNIDSEYVADELYEHIDAPKWLDLSGASPPVDDDAYFCRSDCRHPKTAEDFLTWSPTPKVTPLGERKSNNQNSKRRGRIAAPLLPSPSLREPAKSKANANAKKLFCEDLENRDPNLLPAEATVINGATAIKVAKEAVNPSADESVAEEEEEEEEEKAELVNKKPLPRLKSKLSARNLFSRDILSQLSDFCREIKKMAAVREKPTPKGESNVEEKKVLLESSPKKNYGSGKSSSRLTLKVQTEGENCNKDCGGNTSVLREARGCPPTPQQFPSPSSRRLLRSNKAAASTSSTPLHKPPKSSTLGDHGRGILQELLDQSSEKNRTLAAKDEFGTSVASDSEGSFADMFWFFKPCTHLVNDMVFVHLEKIWHQKRRCLCTS